jgi:ribonuclease P protein component
MPSFSLRRKEKIKKSADYIRVYQKGLKKETPHYKVVILANNLPCSRIGITVSKKIGGSVKRNHVKRRIREYFRLHKTLLPVSSDIVLTAKPGATLLKYAEIATEFNRLFSAEPKRTDQI